MSNVRTALLALAVVLAVDLTAGSRPVAAHIAIRLDILAPRPGQEVSRDTRVVVFAQPMLGGVDRVSFTAHLDGRPLDPLSGTTIEVERRVSVAAGSRRVIPLPGLDPGPHTVSLRYRADTDARAVVTSVEFLVQETRGPGWTVAAAVGGGALVIIFAVSPRLRRRRRG